MLQYHGTKAFINESECRAVTTQVFWGNRLKFYLVTTSTAAWRLACKEKVDLLQDGGVYTKIFFTNALPGNFIFASKPKNLIFALKLRLFLLVSMSNLTA